MVDVQLKDLKQAFEKVGQNRILSSITLLISTIQREADMTPEERAERKKKEIEEEFLRYKMARKIQAAKKKQEGEVGTVARSRVMLNHLCSRRRVPRRV